MELASHHIVEVNIPDGVLESVIWNSNTGDFLFADVIEVKLVLPKQVEAAAERYDVHE